MPKRVNADQLIDRINRIASRPGIGRRAAQLEARELDEYIAKRVEQSQPRAATQPSKRKPGRPAKQSAELRAFALLTRIEGLGVQARALALDCEQVSAELRKQLGAR